VRFSFFILLLCCFSLARAEYTGVAFEITDYDSDWKFADGSTTVAKINSLSLQIEERAESGLTVGGSLAYLSMRVGGDSTSSSTKFDAENLTIYLRQDFPLGESTSLEGLLSYGYHSGRENVEGDRADIQWSQAGVEIGLGFRLDSLRITPFASYTHVDGDINDVSSSRAFELEDPYSYGLRFDFFVDASAYVGVRLQTGSQSGGSISFVRRY